MDQLKAAVQLPRDPMAESVAAHSITGSLAVYLARFRHRIRLCDGWLLAQQSLWIAALTAVLIQLAGHVWPLPSLWLWTLLPLAPWLLIVPGFAMLRPRSLLRTARRVDAELGLKERLATTILLEGGKMRDQAAFQPALVALQRQDALSAAQSIDPHRSFPLRWRKRPLLIAAVLIAVAVALAWLPNRMDAVLQERAAIAQAAEEQAKRIEELRKEIENAQELSPEEREKLLRQLEELAEQLRANPGDREEALADLSRLEEALRPELDPAADARQAALEALAAQLQALAQGETGPKADPAQMEQTLQELAEKLAQMSEAERTELAQSLAQMAARAAQSGDTGLAQALTALAQAAQAGDMQAASAAAQAAANAMQQAQSSLDRQAVLQRVLSQVQSSRQAMSQAGSNQGQGAAQQPGSGQNPGQGNNPGQGQGNNPGQGQGNNPGQGQGQGQGQQPGGGGGAQANQLPPGQRTGQAGRPQGEGRSSEAGKLDQQVYVPWERRQGTGEEVFIPGQDTGQGDTQTRERRDPLPGAPGEVLVPYHEVYYNYLDAANQTMEQSYIPSGLKDYVKEYFSRLEP